MIPTTTTESPLSEQDDESQAEAVETWPTLAEYQAGWDRKLAHHARPVPGEFSWQNLVPEPIPQLWQARGKIDLAVFFHI